ncbi:MAG: YdeI/OmpD-associated family protein [Myxococcota bacterium]
MSEPTYFADAATFRAWLQEHHTSCDTLWVGYFKKASGTPSVTWEETVEEALCFGWIDGVRQSVDADRYRIRFTPRRERSVWSQRNIDLVERLTAEGRMTPAGTAAFAFVDAHPDSGYAVSTMDGALTDAMEARFREHPAAWAFYEGQPAGYRRQAARWVTSAKQEATRTRRLGTLIEDSANGSRIKQLRR